MPIASVGQLTSTSSMLHNLGLCKVLIQKAVKANASCLFLPEATDYISSSAEESLSLVRCADESPFVLGLQKEAKENNISINVGIHEPGGIDRKIKNTSIWIDDTGKITQRYQKLHLFDVDIKGGPHLKESDSIEKGTNILPPFSTPVGRVGLMICFDLRFPEINLSLKRQNAQIITYPSAFTVHTGQAHWETLLRARAIETQAYVLAAAQVGAHNEKRTSYGHSMIIDPWGKVLGELSGEAGEPEILTASIDLDYWETIRKSQPLLRRTDIYPEI